MEKTYPIRIGAAYGTIDLILIKTVKLGYLLCTTIKLQY
ncbi:SunI/YnzG family protein [Bacillus nitratireducens]